ncbi:MAG: hypothetical protein ACI9OD_004005 [Limisphaerales bacterium]|jgi:hypothetical protein
MTLEEEPIGTDSDEDDDREICFQCMEANVVGSHFCAGCGAPLSSYASTAPFESIFAQGHVFRRAIEQPQRRIVMIGLWVLFAPGALGLALLAVDFWLRGEPDQMEALYMLAISSLCVGGLVRATWNRRNTCHGETETEPASKTGPQQSWRPLIVIGVLLLLGYAVYHFLFSLFPAP